MMQVNKEKLKACMVDNCKAEKSEDTVGGDGDKGGAEDVKSKVDTADPPINRNVQSYAHKYSGKVFIGGLPPDIDRAIIFHTFKTYGSFEIEWPNKAHTLHPPKGFAFVIFKDRSSVQKLIDACFVERDCHYINISTPSIKNKYIQVRPWELCDAHYVSDPQMKDNPRNTVFLGGISRTMKASEVAGQISRIFGDVQSVKIDTDWYHKYPIGAARVCFVTHQSFFDAVIQRFIYLECDHSERRVELKANILSNQVCDNCIEYNPPGIPAPYFCTNATCVRYYCINCWAVVHSRTGKEHHKPIVKGHSAPIPKIPYRRC